MKYLIFSLTLILLITGCSRRPVKPVKYHPPAPKKSLSKSQTSAPTQSVQNKTNLQKLYTQYDRWKGAPYKYGGLSPQGVDCSGFVFKTYKNLFDISLPRSTKDQVTLGKRVYINQLVAGDLVFFKTGWNVRHVGIYLEKGKFVHASTSKGVIVSNMNRGYWKENYWQARRLF